MKKIKVGVMGSASDTLPDGVAARLREKAEALGRAIASESILERVTSRYNAQRLEGINARPREIVLLTGATTGLPYIVGRTAYDAGVFHIGVSPASSREEHVSRYELPTDACDVLIYTGFGLKGRNVVLVRSCDIVLFIAGSIGALNELTIAYDEGRIIGCLTGTGGVADEAAGLLETFSKKSRARAFHHDDPEHLLFQCVQELLWPSATEN
jgi:uncharacterized protein (TIGR00725 family)